MEATSSRQTGEGLQALLNTTPGVVIKIENPDFLALRAQSLILKAGKGVLEKLLSQFKDYLEAISLLAEKKKEFKDREADMVVKQEKVEEFLKELRTYVTKFDTRRADQKVTQDDKNEMDSLVSKLKIHEAGLRGDNKEIKLLL